MAVHFRLLPLLILIFSIFFLLHSPPPPPTAPSIHLSQRVHGLQMQQVDEVGREAEGVGALQCVEVDLKLLELTEQVDREFQHLLALQQRQRLRTEYLHLGIQVWFY